MPDEAVLKMLKIVAVQVAYDPSLVHAIIKATRVNDIAQAVRASNNLDDTFQKALVDYGRFYK